MGKSGFQYLEDLATGYWHSEVLFTAIELGLFSLIGAGCESADDLAKTACCRLGPLKRLLSAMEGMALLRREKDRWGLTPISRRWLLPGNDEYLGDFLLYRRYLQAPWSGLTARISRGDRQIHGLSPNDDYLIRNFHYVRAMDSLARRKSEEIAEILSDVPRTSPVLDVGGGAGALARELTKQNPGFWAVLVDLPEVLVAAKQLYPDKSAWARVLPVACDFRLKPPFSTDYRFGMVALSNFLHTYDPTEAKKQLVRAVELTRTDGLILVHDYFPDLQSEKLQSERLLGENSARGGLHDLNMMLNTPDGVCHTVSDISTWLSEIGADVVRVAPLPSDSGVILARVI